MASAVDHLTEQRTETQSRPIPWVTLAWFSVLLILADWLGHIASHLAHRQFRRPQGYPCRGASALPAPLLVAASFGDDGIAGTCSLSER